MTDKDPNCKCGKPRKKTFFKVLGRDVLSNWCEECEVLQKAKDLANIEIEKQAVITWAIKREVDPEYHQAKMSDFKPEILQLLARRDIEKGIFVWGGSGRGKTHLASAMVIQCLKSGKRAKIVELSQLIRSIKASFANQHTEEAIYRPFMKCDFLVIDDIGTTSKLGAQETVFVQDKLLTVIGKRINQKLPTMVTTNLSPEAIYSSFGERIESRMSGFLTFKLEGRDRRKEA